MFHGISCEGSLVVYPFDMFDLRDGYTDVRLEPLTMTGDKISFLVDGHQDVRDGLILRFVLYDDFLKEVKEGLRLFCWIGIAEFSDAVSGERGGGQGIFIACYDFDTSTAKAACGNQCLPASREGDDYPSGSVRFFFLFFHLTYLFYLFKTMQPKGAADSVSEWSGCFGNILS
ncbi:MAG: hypothetical protein ACYS32_04180 [Planctomycetota bacterium]